LATITMTMVTRKFVPHHLEAFLRITAVPVYQEAFGNRRRAYRIGKFKSKVWLSFHCHETPEWGITSG
jgi:hypothetical protein